VAKGGFRPLNDGLPDRLRHRPVMKARTHAIDWIDEGRPSTCGSIVRREIQAHHWSDADGRFQVPYKPARDSGKMRRRIGNYVHQPFAIGIVCCNCAIRRDADVLRVHEQTVAGGSRNEALACDSEQQTAIWPAMQSVCYAGHRKRMHVANEGVQARRARLKSMSPATRRRY
jgi:hypothetical protein